MTDTAAAIVGMSGRFPGAADIAGLWDNLRAGVCSISDFDEAELVADGEDPAELRRTGYVPAGAHLAGADRFEAPLFGFNRTEAGVLDPQHRLLLETAWSALEDAGFNPRDAPDRTGVYVGGGNTEHALAARTDRRLSTEYSGLQLGVLTDREFLAPWLSYKLNLNGPSINVQTACSSSLTAVHLAAQALLLGECDVALAGGVGVHSVRKHGYHYAEGGVLSPDGRCRPFDEKAAGTVPGNGLGLVVLRRLADALADGDPIRAVIRGGAVTNDAATRVGFTAPGVDRQTAAIVEAWATAGLDPSSARYIEMHGTGTALGDRIELAAVTAALAGGDGADGDAADGRCVIGSIKSNLGHLDAAAGIAGLIKVVLMLENRCLAPTVGVDQPRPELASERSPVRLLTTDAQPWHAPSSGDPRRAGVTSVGIGGTNVHVVLEEAPAPDVVSGRPAGHDDEHWQALPLSARTEKQLALTADRLAALLESPNSPALADVALTLRVGRAELDTRGYVLARTSAEAAAALRALACGTKPTDVAPDPLRRLADAWVSGAHVDWPAPTCGTRRVRLPTYPFAGEHYGTLAHCSAAPDEAEAEATDISEAALTLLLTESLGLAGAADLELTFFGAGGDSLAAIHLVDRLEQEYGLEVPLELLLDQLTLRELVAAILTPADAPGSDADLLGALLDEIEAEAQS